ncbi:MAG: protease complex subunit PrcB family protein [Gemmatimonadaceae bacterium]|nr:protease complex subunit PrcB family protein [Gemmatimonadaceae bacterium]
MIARARVLLLALPMLVACSDDASSDATGPVDRTGTVVFSDMMVLYGSLRTTSGLTTVTKDVVKDDAAWSARWRTITAGINAGASDFTTAPPVAFTKDMVLVYGAGQRPTGGYAATIDTVYALSDGIEVVVTNNAPGADCVNTTALTAPMAMVRVARKDGRVVWREKERTVDCR